MREGSSDGSQFRRRHVHKLLYTDSNAGLIAVMHHSFKFGMPMYQPPTPLNRACDHSPSVLRHGAFGSDPCWFGAVALFMMALRGRRSVDTSSVDCCSPQVPSLAV